MASRLPSLRELHNLIGWLHIYRAVCGQRSIQDDDTSPVLEGGDTVSRARERREAALLKRQVPEDDTDESEWDDVSGYELCGDEDDDDAESR